MASNQTPDQLASDVAAYAEDVRKFAEMDPFDPDLLEVEERLTSWQAKLEATIILERQRYIRRMIELHLVLPDFDTWFADFSIDYPDAREIYLETK